MTIEALLNLIWLAVAVAGVGLWRFRWSVSRRNAGHSTGTGAVAVLCVLALLFPVISLTDDLHPEVIPVDSLSSKRNFCLLAAVGPNGVHGKTHSHQPSFFDRSNVHVPVPEPVFAGHLAPAPPLRPLFFSPLRSGRAPPSFS